MSMSPLRAVATGHPARALAKDLSMHLVYGAATGLALRLLERRG